MRKTLLLVSFAAVAMAAQADVLTPEQALGRAMSDGPAKAALKGEAPKLVYTGDIDGKPATYVFEKPLGGYMLLSADDAVAPVLGYSDEAAFDKENIPENMRSWLDMYAQEIAYARANGLTYEAPKPAAAMTAIAPLCTTMWNQESPYNDLCPVRTADGKRAVTGCVATAMAQLMKYHNYPESGQGMGENTSSGFGTTRINFADVRFDWANMLNAYNSKATEAQKQAVAQLMLCCGVSVNMNYGVDASGAVSARVAGALVNNFKYDQAAHYIKRDFYSMTEWKEMAWNELKNVGPVLYSGQSSEGGHCFIVDGYDGSGYFHLNWGWGGMSDGYFLLSALNPSSQGVGGYSPGAGFTGDQGMLLGAKKPVAGSQKYYELTLYDSPFVISQSSTTLGRGINLTSSTYNFSTWDCSGTLGIFITSASGQRQFVGNTKFENIRGMGNYISGLQGYSVTLPSNLASGTYTVTPAWRSAADNKEYPVRVKVNLCGSYTMTVSGSNVTLKANNGAPQLLATKLAVESKVLYAGEPSKFRVTFNNPSANEFYGTISAGLYRTAPTGSGRPDYKGFDLIVDVAPGETIEMPYDVTFKAPAGKYKLCFYNPNDGNKILGNAFDVTFKATPGENETKYEITDFGFIDGITTNVDPSNLGVQFKVECKEGYFHKPDLHVLVSRSNNPNTVPVTLSVPDFALYAGESEFVEVFGSGTLNYSSRYTYNLYLVDGTKYNAAKVLAGPINFTVPNPSGIDDVTTDEAVEVHYYNLQGLPVNFEQAAPGVYVRVSVFADGTTLSERISKR